MCVCLCAEDVHAHTIHCLWLPFQDPESTALRFHALVACSPVCMRSEIQQADSKNKPPISVAICELLPAQKETTRMTHMGGICADL